MRKIIESGIISNSELKKLKSTYKKGDRVELLKMNDRQAPPIGTRGTVELVDDIGTIHVRWDTGSGLGVAYGEDKCVKIDEISIHDFKDSGYKYGSVLGVKVGEKISDKQTIKLLELFYNYYNYTLLENVVEILKKQNLFNEKEFFTMFHRDSKEKVKEKCKLYDPNDKFIPQSKILLYFSVPLSSDFGVEDIERILSRDFSKNLLEHRKDSEEKSRFPWYQPVKVFYRKTHVGFDYVGFTVGTEFRYYPEYVLKGQG